MPEERAHSDAPFLSVVMPVYNERTTIREILRRVEAVPISKEIVLVDDGSTDGTRDVLRQEVVGREGVQVFFQARNQGKGAAIREGLRHTRGEIVIIQDADLEYDPEEYPVLLQPILEGKADVVYGSRFGGGPQRVLLFWHRVGNWMLTTLSNMLTNLNLSDMETCYKVFRSDVIQGMRIRSNRFGFEPEITSKFAKLGCAIYEVPISYSGRDYAEGKKIGWKDGVSALWRILRFGLFCDLDGVGTLGIEMLQRRANRHASWVRDRMAPYAGERVLELGAGIGNRSRFFLHAKELVLTEADPACCRYLRRRFALSEHVTILQGDACRDLPDGFRPDTVICGDALAHTPDAREALERAYRALAPGGRLTALVPAGPGLMGSLDAHLGYVRRYRKEELREALQQAGFVIRDIRYANAPGALTWGWNARVRGRKMVPLWHLKLLDMTVPIWRRVEAVVGAPFGQWLFAVAEKNVKRET